jgi:biopolymer transport protein ExbD
MRFMSPNEDYGSETVDINLSPLIDMVFLLLIFFMVTTVFVKRTALDVTPPEAVTAAPAPDTALIFSVRADGTVRFGEEEIRVASIPGIYRRQTGAGGASRPVIVVADQQSLTGKVVEVIDACRSAGAELVSLATRNRGM